MFSPMVVMVVDNMYRYDDVRRRRKIICLKKKSFNCDLVR